MNLLKIHYESYVLLKDSEPAKNDEVMPLVIKLVNRNVTGLQRIFNILNGMYRC